MLTNTCIHGIAVSHTKTTCSTCYSGWYKQWTRRLGTQRPRDLEVVSSTSGDRLQGSTSSGTDHEVAAGSHGNQEARLGAINESQQHTRSLLSVLKAPTASNLSRKRVQAANPPSGKRRRRGTSTNDPKGIDPARRVKEYPNEQLSVSNKKLFCKACREELSLKKSSVENHIK